MTNQYQYRTITKTCPQQSHPCPSWHGNFIQIFSFWCAWDQKGWRTRWTMGSEGKRPRNSCSNTSVLSEYPWFGDRFPCVGAPSKNSQCLCASTCKIQSCSVIASRSHNRHRPDCGRVNPAVVFCALLRMRRGVGPSPQNTTIIRVSLELTNMACYELMKCTMDFCGWTQQLVQSQSPEESAAIHHLPGLWGVWCPGKGFITLW